MTILVIFSSLESYYSDIQMYILLNIKHHLIKFSFMTILHTKWNSFYKYIHKWLEQIFFKYFKIYSILKNLLQIFILNTHNVNKKLVIFFTYILLTHYFCFQVKRFSYTTSTEDSTSSPQTWSMERKCTSKCDPGCIVIGERTKLSACTTCCEQSFCNVGTGAANELTINWIDLFLALVLQITLTIIIHPSWHCKRNDSQFSL